jgi:hypothetical protein
VIATFYDATGKIVEFETAGTSPSEISAGQSSDLMVDAVIGEWGNWTAETQSITSANVTAYSDGYLAMLEPQ